MEMSIFLSLAFTEILHFFYILKWNNVLFEQLHLLTTAFLRRRFSATLKKKKKSKITRLKS